jgi:hypothetical protein
VVKIKVYPASLYNYPDIRIRVCPEDDALINLSKYIDTVEVTSIKWESASHVQILNTVSGIIPANNLNPGASVYTFTYTVDNPCLDAPVTRKVYLEALKPGKMRPLRDSVKICYKFAEALQINQIFGIDARGDWTFTATVNGVDDVDVTSYLKTSHHVAESTSPYFDDAVIMNGKAIYSDSYIDSYIYNGKTEKQVTVTYTPASDSCLAGKTYTIKIILTEDIVN